MPTPTLSRRRVLMLMASGLAAQAAPATRCESATLEPWSRFRGPSGSGIAPPGVEYPVEFGPKRNVIWKRAFPAGKSSLILTPNRILLTAETGDRLQVIAVDRHSGKTAWERSLQRSRNEYKNPLNDAASSPAVTDGANVYAFFGDMVSFHSMPTDANAGERRLRRAPVCGAVLRHPCSRAIPSCYWLTALPILRRWVSIAAPAACNGNRRARRLR